VPPAPVLGVDDDVPIGAYANPVTHRINQLLEQVQATAAPANEPIRLPSQFNCSVCWTGHDRGPHMPLVFNCGHILCLSCVAQLPQLQCQFCRQEITFVVRLFI
jgi:hypothetical protein